MKPYASPKPRVAVVKAEPRREARIDRIAVISLIVAGLATIASIVQLVLSYLAVDTPYVTLVYSEQVKRSVEAVDFMTRLRADVERWEAMYGNKKMDLAATQPEIEDRMRRFAELSQGAWLLTDTSQKAVGAAAADFNTFVVTCLVPRYDGGEPLVGDCGARFERHETSLERAKSEVLRDIKFDYRNTSALARKVSK